MEDNYTKLVIGYLQGSLSAEETDQFYSWVNESPSNKELFFGIKAMYDAGNDLGKPFDGEKSWKRLLKKRMESRPRRLNLWYKIGSYAAVALIAIALSSTYFIYFSPDNDGFSTRYIGGDGLQADVVELPDGTRVSLGSKTSFHYDKKYGEDKRIVYLEGEAYFEVAKDKEHPFIVKTKEQDVEVLGTKFNVMAFPADSLIITTLLEGSVRLTTLGLPKQTILKPNQQFVYNRNTKSVSLRGVDAQQFVSWTSGYYYFSEESLDTILDRLGHVYGVQFAVSSEKLNHRTFTGTFYRGQSIKDIMEIINLSIPIKYKVNDQQVTIFE